MNMLGESNKKELVIVHNQGIEEGEQETQNPAS